MIEVKTEMLAVDMKKEEKIALLHLGDRTDKGCY